MEADQLDDGRFIACVAGTGIDARVDVEACPVQPPQVRLVSSVVGGVNPAPAYILLADGAEFDQVLGPKRDR